ncbi:MAG: FGGY-family carbohydrate kinase [Treponema sp.]|jgi:xylulokinase|nr:FGGY-family carbohydrate kinase [Treponema sp.]
MYALTYDVGTTGLKTCLFSISGKLELAESAYAGYGLYTLENGGVEQDPEEWWQAVCSTSREVIKKAGIRGEDVEALSFCSQMQCLVLVDSEGRPVRRAMSYLDSRAQRQHAKGISGGFAIGGLNVRKLLVSLAFTKAMAASVKDPVWKYNWVRENEPENFSRVCKWLDAKEYLIARMTGNMCMTHDSAYATMLYDVRPGKEGWCPPICKMLGVNPDHLPPLIKSSDSAGRLGSRAAEQLGLKEGAPVYGGGGDAVLIGVGTGATELGDTYVYLGTSGWVSTLIDRQILDIDSRIASIIGPQPGRFHYFAEIETAAKCLEWVKDHLALDEIGIYLEKKNVTESLEKVYMNLYDYLCEVVSRVPAGSGGVIFTPWLHGNRCPFEDPNARGIFFNIGLETGKSALIRAVIEGICYHCRLALEAEEKRVKISDSVMVSGGGALSSVICQILADVLGRRVLVLPNPQNSGSFGAAIVIAAGLGKIPSIEDAKTLLPPYTAYTPIKENKLVHDRNYLVFKSLYRDNKKSFALLNSRPE